MRPVFALLIALIPAAVMAAPAKSEHLVARLEQDLPLDGPTNVLTFTLVRVDVMESDTSPIDHRVEITCVERRRFENGKRNPKPCPAGLHYSGPGSDAVLGVQQIYVPKAPQFAILWDSGTGSQIEVFQVTNESIREVFNWRGKVMPELRTLPDRTPAIAIVEHFEAGMPTIPAPTIFRWDGTTYQRQP